MDYNINDIINQVNKDIKEIKEFGLQPVTLKSPANIIEKFIEPKGTSREGEFKTYEQYISEHGYISQEEYNNYVMNFIADYHSQLYLEGAIDYQVKAVIHSLEDRVSDDFMASLETMSKEDLIDLIREAGEAANEAVRNGGYSDIFYYYLEQFRDNYK